MEKKKQFYEEYDALFIKPKPPKKKKRPFLSLWQRANKAPVLSTKKQAQQPSKKNSNLNRRTHTQTISKKWAIILPIGLFLMILVIVYASNHSEIFSDDYEDDYSDYVDVYPLQEAGIKRTGTVDVSQPLVATLDDPTIYFNKGYKIEIKGDVDIEQHEEELSVLPTNGDYPSITSIASLSFYSGRDYLRSVNMSMSGNLAASISRYLQVSKGDDLFSKAYPQESLDDVQTGYVVNYEKESSYIYLSIQRYFMFPDGTGVWLETYSTSDQETELTPDDSFKEIKKAYREDFEFLEDNFLLTTDNSADQ